MYIFWCYIFSIADEDLRCLIETSCNFNVHLFTFFSQWQTIFYNVDHDSWLQIQYFSILALKQYSNLVLTDEKRQRQGEQK